MTPTHPVNGSGSRQRQLVIAVIAALALTALVVVSSSGPAAAHEGHLAEAASTVDPGGPSTTNTTMASKTEIKSETKTTTSTTSVATRTESRTKTAETARIARLAIDRFHLAKINDVDIAVFDQHRTTGDLVFTGGRGQANPLNVDCYVDFDDDLTIQYHVPGGAEDTFMTGQWYQKCFDDYYPAVAVKHLNWGHFHLGYEDPRIGPCSGDQTDWGRKADPTPSDQDELGAWVIAPCESDIDPVTEPRSGISAHLPGHLGKIVAYDGDGHRPFQLRTLEVVSGEVEVCYRSPGPVVVANGGGSPWHCTTWGEGYWDMSDHVPSAIEVQFEFLTNGEIDNVGVDLL